MSYPKFRMVGHPFEMLPPILQVVTSVLQRQAHADALQNLGPSISNFIGPNPSLSLKEAAKFGSIKLLDWIWYNSCISVDDRTSEWTLTNFLRSDEFYYRFQFAETTEIAAERGDLAMMEYLFSHFSACVVPKEAISFAASKGHLDILQFLLQHDSGHRYGDAPSSKRRKVIGKNGDAGAQSIVGVSSSGDHSVDWGDHHGRNIEQAIYNGHTDVTRWLYDLVGHELTSQERESIIQSALGGGDIEFAELIVPEGRSVLDYAGYCARPEVVERRLESEQLEGDGVIGSIIRELARNGHLELLKRVAQLYSGPPRLDYAKINYWHGAMLAGCDRGDVPMVQWLLEHPRGREIRIYFKSKLSHLICVAAKKNCVDLMQYLYNRGVQLRCRCGMINAAFHGQLAALKWFAKYLPERVRSAASRLVKEAANRGHVEILQYFHESADFWPFEACYLMDLAVRKGRFAVIEWLHEFHPERCSLDAIDEAATNGNLDVVEWLYRNTATRCTFRAMDGAAANGHLKTMKWLYKYGSGGCTVKAVEHVVRSGHVEIVCWLRVHFPSYKPTEGTVRVHRGDRFGMLFFLKTLYPHIFSPSFVRQQKRLLKKGGYEKNSLSYIVDWLNSVDLDDLDESGFDEGSQD